jgi:hypothetical protein
MDLSFEKMINQEKMDENVNVVEELIEKSTEYIKWGVELVKLKTIDKTSDVVSTLVPLSIVFLLLTSFLIFLNLGIAFWLGHILNNTFYGFFVVAGFYAVAALIIHFFLHKWLKKKIGNYMVKQLLK